MITLRTFFAPLMLPLALACASDPAPAPGGPGPMRPLGPDHELDAGTPIAITDEAAMRAWLSARIAAANAGQRERVRLPVVRRAVTPGCDCPTFAIAPTADTGPSYLVDLVDLTSAGIPPGDWVGWVDGRFTGELRTYRSTETGADVLSVIFEVTAQRRRSPDDPPEARFVAIKK